MAGVEGGTAEALCRKNTIIYIGDTNTHRDNDVPNFENQAGFPGGMKNTQTVDSSAYADNIPTADYFKALLSFQKSKYAWTANFGSILSGGGMAGLAYWARVNNIRPDIKGNSDVDINVNSFFIDVVEGNDFKEGAGGTDEANRNIYYLAAKFGGFDTSVASKSTYNGLGVDLTIPNPVTARSSWTDDAAGNPTISNFRGGVPRNYAPANDPDKMKTALKNAFASAGTSASTSQTAATFTSENSKQIELSSGKSVVLTTTFNAKEWTGNVLAYTASSSASTATIDTSAALWNASSLLNNAYYSTDKTKWNARNVYSMANGTILRFNPDNAAAFSAAVSSGTIGVDTAGIVSYVLGDKSREGANEEPVYQTRSSLLGTVVNSKVAAVLAPSVAPVAGTCTYANTAIKSRAPFYAFAANDGMFHVLNENGNEIFAYLPSTALPKLYQYALPAYNHFFMNDGSPVTAELCGGSVAKTYLVGSAGRGGRAVYALDATDLSNPGSGNVLWEFNGDADSDFGYATGDVVLSTDYNGNPVAIFSSGYWSNDSSASNDGYLYVVQLNKKGPWNGSTSPDSVLGQKGINFLKIKLGNSGVGSPFAFDFDNDGVADRIYVGDQAGKVWRVDQSGANSAGSKKGSWAVAYGGKPLFSSDEAKPINTAPYVQTVKGVTYVVAGTGLTFSSTNLAANIQNYGYGFFDTGSDGTITSSDLLSQTVSSVASTTNSSGIEFSTSTSSKLKSTQRGWRLQLPVGEVVTSALIYQKQLAYFGTTNLSKSDAGTCGQSFDINGHFIKVTDGGLPDVPMFDTNGDGLIDSSDGIYSSFKITGSNNSTSGFAATDDGIYITVIIDGVPVTIKINSLSKKAYVRRLSWRQLMD